ncbi:hypothetical protein GCM10009789_66200 [Kribbella sancticallisti]|uniref:Uncharacterized protein n=1 Tax=Kribbella sancticallisti TaxID=460087 RepID=A0ABP4Q9D2_9ACTN
MTPRAPTLMAIPGPGVAAGVPGGRGMTMADVFDEILDDELTDDDLDELEALGAAEDTELILGQIDA